MKLYKIHHVQKLPISAETAWAFLSDPANLGKITPKAMGFVTLSGDDRAIFPGQIIEYKIKPLFGISINWVTEITHVIPNIFFVDEQR
ncbi:MAG TPA: cell division inhibitor, partial [Flavobacterium sp.]|nr:cell division inhibitor [Flavobacterium sp.]